MIDVFLAEINILQSQERKPPIRGPLGQSYVRPAVLVSHEVQDQFPYLGTIRTSSQLYRPHYRRFQLESELEQSARLTTTDSLLQVSPQASVLRIIQHKQEGSWILLNNPRSIPQCFLCCETSPRDSSPGHLHPCGNFPSLCGSVSHRH